MIDSEQIFNIKSEKEFENIALEIFRFQAKYNPVYQSYLLHLGIDVNAVNFIEEIPFLPIQFFKSHKVLVEDENILRQAQDDARQAQDDVRQAQDDVRQVQDGVQQTQDDVQQAHTKQAQEDGHADLVEAFTSSGTTSATQSKHYVSDISLYHHSLEVSFKQFYGKFSDYCILALLPSYLERKGSSLIEMVNVWMQKSNHKNNGFFLYNHQELKGKLLENKALNQPTILIGVSFALLDFAEEFQLELPNTIVIETGGMKGRKKEIIREELHQILDKNLNPKRIDSEYGMTELLSQCYAQGNQRFKCPNWMKILIRETEDPFKLSKKSGGINVIDLANLNSCSFIATDDLGTQHSDGSFEILGRFDHSDVRGCSLLLHE